MNAIYDELRIALHSVWNRRWLALAVAWGICILGWLVVALIPNRYEAKARVYVETKSLLPSQIGITPADQQQAIEGVRQTLTSAANLQKVVRGTDLGLGLATDAAVAGKAAGLREKIKVVSTQNNLFEITATSADRSLSDGANARLAAAVAQKLIDIFVADNISGTRDETSRTLRFLDAQIVERGRKLAEAEQRLSAFEQKYMGILPGTGSIADRLNAGRQQIGEIETQLIPAQSALAAIDAQVGSTPAMIGSGAGGAAAPTALGQAQADLAAARARGWTDSHPDVIALKQQITNLRAIGGGGGGGGTTQTPNPMYLQLKSMQAERQSTVTALSARKAQLQSDINRMIAAQAEDSGVTGEQAQIARDYAVLKDQYDKLLADREQAKLRGDAQTETDGIKFSVIEPPAVPRVPAAPNRPLLLLGVLIVGIGGGFASAFALGQLRGTYPTAARLEQASGMKVIGSITETVSVAQQALRRQRLKWFLGGSGALALVCLALVGLEFVQRGLAA